MKIETGRESGFTLVEIMIVVAIIGLLAAIAIPNFVKARETAQMNAIVNNLRIIESSKDQWALEAKKGTGDVPTSANLTDYLKNNRMPTAVVGETYNINAIGTGASATTPVRLGTYAANSNVTIP